MELGLGTGKLVDHVHHLPLHKTIYVCCLAVASTQQQAAIYSLVGLAAEICYCTRKACLYLL